MFRSLSMPLASLSSRQQSTTRYGEVISGFYFELKSSPFIFWWTLTTCINSCVRQILFITRPYVEQRHRQTSVIQLSICFNLCFCCYLPFMRLGCWLCAQICFRRRKIKRKQQEEMAKLPKGLKNQKEARENPSECWRNADLRKRWRWPSQPSKKEDTRGAEI